MNLIEIIRPTTSWLFDGKAGSVYIEGKKLHNVQISSAPVGRKKYIYELTDDVEPIKKCSMCGLEKLAQEFSPSKVHRSGRRRECRDCRNIYERRRDAIRRMSASMRNGRKRRKCSTDR